MSYQIIEDHTQMRVGDMLEFRCPSFGLVTQWKVEGIHLGGLNQESLIELRSVTKVNPTNEVWRMAVPEQMTRALTIVRPSSS